MEPIAKIIRPAMNTRRRPSTSPSRAPAIRTAATATKKPSIIHRRSAS
ncbi:unannotated protein [freshwater metagenome]|uniref:Unannotated protein n=1 Tax=freshwater metagenome TaxID=449393 RepID=A0A6J7NY32_9ZZZZ